MIIAAVAGAGVLGFILYTRMTSDDSGSTKKGDPGDGSGSFTFTDNPLTRTTGSVFTGVGGLATGVVGGVGSVFTGVTSPLFGALGFHPVGAWKVGQRVMLDQVRTNAGGDFGDILIKPYGTVCKVGSDGAPTVRWEAYVNLSHPDPPQWNRDTWGSEQYARTYLGDCGVNPSAQHLSLRSVFGRDDRDLMPADDEDRTPGGGIPQTAPEVAWTIATDAFEGTPLEEPLAPIVGVVDQGINTARESVNAVIPEPVQSFVAATPGAQIYTGGSNVVIQGANQLTSPIKGFF